MAKRTWRAAPWSLRGKPEGKRRGPRRRNTLRHQCIRLVLPSTPAVNAGQRQRARLRNVSAVKPLASAWHSGAWVSVPTALPRPDGTGRHTRGTRKGKRGKGRGSGNGGGDDWRRARRHGQRERGEGERRRAKGRPSRLETRQRRNHPSKVKGRRSTCQDTSPPRRTYVSGRSTETGYMQIPARTWTAASKTTRHVRRGGVTLQSCHQGTMKRRVGRSADGLSGRCGE